MLSDQVLAPKIRITMIPAPDEAGEDAARDGGVGGSDPAANRAARIKTEQEALTPDLIAFLHAHPEIKAVAKVAQVHSDASRLGSANI